MRKFTTTILNDINYICLLTALDCEINFNDILNKLCFGSSKKDRKVLIDLALSNGINEHRFIEVDIDSKGKAKISDARNINPSTDLLAMANCALKHESKVVKNSILSESQKQMILN